MATKHNIICTDFSYDRMLELPAQEARKDYILNFFVPVAYEMVNSLTEPGTEFVGMLLHRTNDFYRPIFVRGWDDNGCCVFDDFNVLPVNTSTILGDQVYVRHYEKIMGLKLDVEQQSKALRHAFSDCFAPSNVSCNYWLDCPILASFYSYHDANLQAKYGLNIVCKTKDSVPNSDLLHSHVCTRIAALSSSNKYDGRIFNNLTGEWLGLCDPGSPCESCAKIFASPAADNAYNDSELA